jgi:hypothetical protein
MSSPGHDCRDTNPDPDCFRVGTDIVGGTPAPTFDEAFTLAGVHSSRAGDAPAIRDRIDRVQPTAYSTGSGPA